MDINTILNKKSITVDEFKTEYEHGGGDYVVTTVTKVPLAAKHKALDIKKISISLMNLPESSDVYTDLVIATSIANGTDVDEANKFEPSKSRYTHTECYPMCDNIKGDTQYLYGFSSKSDQFDTVSPVYVMDNEVISKDDIIQYLTPSAARVLSESNNIVENKKHDIKHSVFVKTIKLENVKEVKIL